MAEKKHYPHWAYPSLHAFRAEKRRELRVLKKAAENLRAGCAYMPDGGECVGLILDRIGLLTEQLSVRRWGR